MVGSRNIEANKGIIRGPSTWSLSSLQFSTEGTWYMLGRSESHEWKRGIDRFGSLIEDLNPELRTNLKATPSMLCGYIY